MSNANYYVCIEYYYKKIGVYNYRFKESFASEQEAMKFASNLVHGAINDLRQNSPIDKKFHIFNNDRSVGIVCLVTSEDDKTISSIISYTVVQDN